VIKKNLISIVKNKYIVVSLFFVTYALFLDDYDIFTLLNQKKRLSVIIEKKEKVDQNLLITKETLNDLRSMENVVNYARSVKFFKKDDEDIFIITRE
jgi:cell division protein DivIC